MTNLSLIAAMTPSYGIGKNNSLPWPKITEDMAHFVRTTKGKPMIMGYTTLESFGVKPDGSYRTLPGRRHVVVSNSREIEQDQIQVVRSIDEALEAVEGQDATVIGGASIYNQMMQYCNGMHLTVVDKEFDCDTYFPAFDSDEWNLATDVVKKNAEMKQNKEVVGYVDLKFQTWSRI